jgi:hypothetical protein
LSNVLVTGVPGAICPGVLKEASRSPHPFSAVPATLSRLCGGPAVVVQVTFPPTLIVVTGVPLASSCHFRPTFFTLAVVGADALGVADGTDGADVGVAVAVVVLVGALVGEDVVQPTNKIDVRANPRSLYIVSPLSISAYSNRPKWLKIQFAIRLESSDLTIHDESARSAV